MRFQTGNSMFQKKLISPYHTAPKTLDMRSHICGFSYWMSCSPQVRLMHAFTRPLIYHAPPRYKAMF